jgi:hypothetical protein
MDGARDQFLAGPDSPRISTCGSFETTRAIVR